MSKVFPIQDGPSVPWSYMAPHESQAMKNHGQTLARLADRGGLGAAEAELIVAAQPLCPKSGEWDWAELKRRWVERAERVNREYAALTAERDALKAACETLLACDRETDPGTGLALLQQAVEQARAALKLCEVQQ